VAEQGKPHLEQGQAEPMGSLPQKVRVDRMSQRATADQDEWTPENRIRLTIHSFIFKKGVRNEY